MRWAYLKNMQSIAARKKAVATYRQYKKPVQKETPAGLQGLPRMAKMFGLFFLFDLECPRNIETKLDIPICPVIYCFGKENTLIHTYCVGKM